MPNIGGDFYFHFVYLCNPSSPLCLNLRMTIAKATLDHMPEVARVLRASFRDTYPTFPELHTDEEDRAFFTDVVFPKNEIYIAEDASGKIVGFIAFNNEFIDHL